jgi:hypothetical protein
MEGNSVRGAQHNSSYPLNQGWTFRNLPGNTGNPNLQGFHGVVRPYGGTGTVYFLPDVIYPIGCPSYTYHGNFARLVE